MQGFVYNEKGRGRTPSKSCLPSTSLSTEVQRLGWRHTLLSMSPSHVALYLSKTPLRPSHHAHGSDGRIEGILERKGRSGSGGAGGVRSGFRSEWLCAGRCRREVGWDTTWMYNDGGGRTECREVLYSDVCVVYRRCDQCWSTTREGVKAVPSSLLSFRSIDGVVQTPNQLGEMWTRVLGG